MISSPTEETHAAAVPLTGATGYIGGCLVPTLEVSGVRFCCLARRPRSEPGRA